MEQKPFQHYLTNCFLLTIPILVWNIALANKLPKVFQPDIFWANISPIVKYGENISRFVLFILTALMPLSLSTTKQKKGLSVYLAGLFFYFLSWVLLIYFPNSVWSNSLLGFMAPAYTPILWLAGVWLIGNSYYFSLPLNRYIFLAVCVLFLLFHNIHTYIIYTRNHY